MTPKELRRALQPFAVLDPTHLPVHFVQVFLVVAEREPCNLRVIEKELDLSNSAVSRTIAALGQVNRKGQPGFDLVAHERDPGEGRRFLVFLTAKGKAMARQLRDL